MKKSLIAAFALMVAASPALAEEGKGPHGQGHHGKFFEKVDTDKDGRISRAEFAAKGDRMFLKADADKDGFISRDEGQKFHEARRAKWKAHKEEMKQKAGEAK